LLLRKEIKYVIPIVQFYGMQRELGALMAPDVHCGPNGYMVRSLYFDSAFNTDLHDSLDGLLIKGKIRLRLYSHDSKSVKLEYKRKHDHDGAKHVLTISREQAERMAFSDYDFLQTMDNPLARQIWLRLTEGAYRPASIVEYTRYAYAYPASDIRITFDRDIRTSCAPLAFFDEAPALFPMCPGDQGVFEVKYNDFLPAVFKGIIKRLDMIPQANSKYMQSRLFY